MHMFEYLFMNLNICSYIASYSNETPHIFRSAHTKIKIINIEPKNITLTRMHLYENKVWHLYECWCIFDLLDNEKYYTRMHLSISSIS